MKRSDWIKILTVTIEQNRKTRIKSEDLALYIMDLERKYGMLPPYSAEKAKIPRPTGHEWDDE